MQIALPCCFKIEFGAQAQIQLPRKTRQLPLMGKIIERICEYGNKVKLLIPRKSV